MNRGKPVVAPSTVGIETLDDLRKHLQWAIEVEHATLPPYLCAHYYRFQELKRGRRYRRGDTPQSGPTGEAISVDLGGVYPAMLGAATGKMYALKARRRP